jgi:predicted acetyltransferase
VSLELRDARGSAADREWLTRVYPFYLHDLSEFDDGYYRLDEQGRWTPDHLPDWLDDATDHPLILVESGERVGAALINQAPSPHMSPGVGFRMAEFFVLRAHRGRGTGRRAVFALFDRFPGVWEISGAAAERPRHPLLAPRDRRVQQRPVPRDAGRLRGAPGPRYYPVVRSTFSDRRRSNSLNVPVAGRPRGVRSRAWRLLPGWAFHLEEERAMLRPLKEILSYKILATDGEIGGVSDLIVDDQEMKLRYLVIDTGSWLPGKKVVLSTAWISSVVPQKETVVMNIEKKRIQEAPEYRPDAVFDRDYETRLHDYYRFPYYWL